MIVVLGFALVDKDADNQKTGKNEEEVNPTPAQGENASDVM